jgi:N-acetylglutamate synthase-like GNAT family acetyltransferase
VIRHADRDDLDAIVAMGLTFLATVYGEKLTAPPDPTRIRAYVSSLLDDADTRALFVNEHDGALTGMFGLHLFTHPMTGQIVAAELFWWVNPDRRGLDGLRLLARARAWATQAGAQLLQMVAPDAAVAQLYERLGYTRIETAYVTTL